MASSFTIIALFSLALFAEIIEARKDLGLYLQDTAKSEDFVEAIEQLVHLESSNSNGRKITSGDCHTSEKAKSFVKDFEPRPSLTAYGDDTKLKGDKNFIKNFEPRPSITAYGDDAKLKGDKNFIKDFEPRPSITAYGDDTKLKGDKNFIKDFEPRPSITAYGDGEDKNFIKDFETRPSMTAYQE